jgi:two-component system, NarL family, sensor histidine kinase BarA
MFDKLRRMRMSLATKCQILYGAALILIIGVALLVPWKRMEDLIGEVNFQTAKGLVDQAVLEHVNYARNPAANAANIFATSRPATQSVQQNPGTSSIGEEEFFWPRLIPVNPPKSMELDAFEKRALADFSRNPLADHFAGTYSLHGTERYRLAIPQYNKTNCLRCHDESAEFAAFSPPSAGVTTMPASAAAQPSEKHLVGIVLVDIPSNTGQLLLFLNRLWFIVAGLIAGGLAVSIFYLITSRLILRPVQILQDTAEKVSQGDLNIRSEIASGDEFQQLSQTFNTMLINLKSSDEQLRASNKALDLKLDQLAQTNVALYESNRLKSEFLANVSHELRTPLNSILGFADLLRETVSASPDAKSMRYLQNILASGRNLLELINDLLDLAKIEAGRMDVRSEPLSLNDIFEGLISLLKPLSETRGLVIEAVVQQDVPIMHTDPAKIQQVLYNFLSNAIKFSPVGGQIALLATMETDETVRISVADRGPGIDPLRHSEIFEKFRQIDGSVTRQHGGTGLGLAISKELVLLLGGTIGVESLPNYGSTFWIILPIKTQAGQRDVRMQATV